jgi:hypothetical protein
MTTAARRGHAAGAAGWDADSGPPSAELLPRADRGAASFSTRILAHVLGELWSRSPRPSSSLPLVLGVVDGAEPVLSGPLRRVLTPRCALSQISAGVATVPMMLIEALAMLTQHDAVLVACAQDAAPPHHEALAAALLLTREPSSPTSLVLEAPTLRRTFSHSERKVRHRHPLASALALARAINVGQPTVETVPSCESDRPERWQIELTHGF